MRHLVLSGALLVSGLAGGSLARAQATLFRFPAEDPKGEYFMEAPIIHVDHDPVVDKLGIKCLSYSGQGFPWCYDGHRGTDYLLLFGFATMDQHNVKIVAAADGLVIRAEDGNYDRCSGKVGSEVTCDGYPMKGNGVEVRHLDGARTIYWHMKKGSVKVTAGDVVRCGQLLGYVGSSGISATPHLHFEVRGAEDEAVDPYAGPHSQSQSYWTLQSGPFGRPGERCRGVPYKDGGIDGPGLLADAGTEASGCAVSGTRGSTWPGRSRSLKPAFPLFFALLLTLARCARRRGRP